MKQFRLALALFALALCLIPIVGIAQRSAQRAVVELPNGPITRIVSPNNKWTLIFECPNLSEERTLWIEDKSRDRRLVGKYERSLDISWAPNGSLFFVNDNSGSNGSESGVIDPITLKRTDLGSIISNHDAKAKQYLRAGHSYVRAKRWLNDHTITVVLFGHFDEPPAAGFTAKYRVKLNGSSKRIFLHPVEEPQ